MANKLWELMDEGIAIAEELELEWSDMTIPIDPMSMTMCDLGCMALPLLPEGDRVHHLDTASAIELIAEKFPQIKNEVEVPRKDEVATRTIANMIWLYNDGFHTFTDHPYAPTEMRDWLKERDL